MRWLMMVVQVVVGGKGGWGGGGAQNTKSSPTPTPYKLKLQVHGLLERVFVYKCLTSRAGWDFTIDTEP